MAQKIIMLTGSPRKEGNTNTVSGWVADAARAAGAEVDVVNTADLEYAANGCTECMACQKSDKYECVIDDQASPIIARIPQYDVLVLATPVFWFGPTAQLKLLLDRTFALVKFDQETGEPITSTAKGTLALVATAAGDLEAGLNLLDTTFRTASVFMKCKYESLLIPFAPSDHHEMAQRSDVKADATAFGKLLAGE